METAQNPQYPQPHPAVPNAAQPRSIHVLGVVTMALLGLCGVSELGVGLVNLTTYRLLGDLVAGRESVSQTELESNDALLLGVTGLQLIVLIVTMVCFVIWLWRARTNSERIFPDNIHAHRRARAWVILGWIIPIVSFWFPKQIVDDVWRTSDKNDPPGTALEFLRPTGLVTAWWLVFVAYQWGGNAVERMGLRAETAEELRTAAAVAVWMAPVGIASAILAIVVVHRITTMQENSIGARIG